MITDINGEDRLSDTRRQARALASAKLTRCSLWTLDKALAWIADKLRLSA